MNQTDDRDASAAHLASQRPTHVRWRVLALLMALAFMGHFNRIGMSVAGDESLKSEFALSDTQLGWVYSAFLIVYTIFMTPGGWLIDRLGPRKALVGMGFAAALLSAATCLPAALPVVWVWPALLLIRSIDGAMNVPLHPGAVRAVSYWLPSGARAQGNGLVSFAAVVGIAMCYPAFGWLIDHVEWPATFVIGGAGLAVVAVLLAAVATDRPSQHPRVNAAERLLIESTGSPASGELNDSNTPSAMSLSSPETPITVGRQPSWGAVMARLRNRSLILLTISYAAVGYVQYLFFYWLKHYLEDTVGLTIPESRKYAMFATLAMAVGMVFGGMLSDWLETIRRTRSSRRLVPVAGLLASAFFVHLGVSTEHVGWIVTSFSLAMAAVGMCEGPSWKLAVELGGSNGGASAAIINTGSNAGGLVAPILTPWLAEEMDFGWKNSVLLASVVCLVGAALWFWIDPNERVE